MAQKHSGFRALTPITFGTGGTAVGGAPAFFVNGPLMSTPSNGAVEYTGTHLYVSIGVTRYQLDQQAGGTITATESFARTFAFMGA